MTNLRRAERQDAPALEAFLAEYSDTSMFLRGNLAAHGIGNTTHPHGTTYWLADEGVVACSNSGFLMCQAPQGGLAFWQAATRAIEGREIQGITGVPEQVDAWLAALGLLPELFSLKRTEPLYRLDLADLRAPDLTDLHLRTPDTADVSMVREWFAGYALDTGLAAGATDWASGATAAFMANDAARLLEKGGAPVAMASLNARVADTVQVGGVYVPRDLRGQGLGGAIVAAQLRQLRAGGVTRAVLFAASSAAAQVYERIGFDQVGRYEIAVLRTPLTVERTSDVFPT